MQAQDTAKEIINLITKIYGDHNDRGPEETILAQEIVTAINEKYIGGNIKRSIRRCKHE